MICAACMTPQKCGQVGCRVQHPERHPPPAGGLQEHALRVADPDEAYENALRKEPGRWVVIWWRIKTRTRRIASLFTVGGSKR